MAGPRIGVDLGGTKIEALLLDAHGAEVRRRRIPTPPDYAATLAAIVNLVAELEAGPARATVGVGLPGTVIPSTGLVKNANRDWLNGRAFPADLERALRRPVRCANDGDCFAASEARDGAGVGASVLFAAVLGTGCGAGLAFAGRPWRGACGLTGEWGHNALPWPEPNEYPGPDCPCGKRGCIEAWLSGPALEADHQRRTGDCASALELGGRAARGDVEARDTLRRWLSRLARALATVVNLLDPDVIVIGGGLSKLPALFEALPAAVASHVFGGDCATRFSPARHGDASGVRGAAFLW